jgi:2-polyprenyl-3-methyl-5-hydroxy-6-metoxy-1,4-benzoquinol methylase
VTAALRQDQAAHFDARSPFTPMSRELRACGFRLPYIMKDVLISQAISQPRPSPGDRVLDIGCGKGFMLDRLASSYETVGYGVDVSRESLRAARSESLHALHVAASDGSCLPFPNSCFDLVICFDVLEHVPDPEAVIVEMLRVLKSEGRVIFYAVSSKNTFTLNWFLAKGLDLLHVDYWSWSAHSPDRLVDPGLAVAFLEGQGCRIRLYKPFHAFFTILFDQSVLVLYWVVEKLKGIVGPRDDDTTSGSRLVSLVSRICVRLLGPLESLDAPWVKRGLSNGFLISARKPR